MRLYLDVCCLNRPFDDQTQGRIRLEAEAVLLILGRCEAAEWEWISSEVVDVEIGRTPDPERRRRTSHLSEHAHQRVRVAQQQIERAETLSSWGFGAYDALHIACAESGAVDVFLTTDDTLLRRASTLVHELRVRVCNPLVWLSEEERLR